jgi:hypothetical protein
MDPGVHCVRSRTGPVAVRLQENYSSGLEPLTCTLRVHGQWLLNVARVCISRISKRIFVPSFAHHCRVLHAG